MSDDLFRIELSRLQPSQLYISARKLSRVLEELDQGSDRRDRPLPVKRLDGDVILTDGHTRALAEYLVGSNEIGAYWDTDDLDWEAYSICIRWCKEEGVRTIADLARRVLRSDRYVVLWLERCRLMHEDLQARRSP